MGAKLVPERTHVAPGKRLGFTLVNDGPGRIFFGQIYKVQREHDGAWIDADVHPPNAAFTLEAHAMRAGGTFASALVLRDDVPPGRYRVTKRVGTEGPGDVTVSFEFAVARPGTN